MTAIDYTAAHIQTLEMQVIRLRAERDTLERDNRYLKRALKAALSQIDASAVYCDGFADGANLRTVGERVMALEEDFGELVV